MAIIVFLIFAVLSLLGWSPQWQAAAFDLDDREAARAKYAEIVGVEGVAAQGQAWCALSSAEVRAMARHTEMSNIITFTIHIIRDGKRIDSYTIKPAPNQDELVEYWVRRVGDGCRYNAWGNLERLNAAADDAERLEVLCSLDPDEAAILLRFKRDVFIIESSKGVASTGESADSTINRPPVPASETAIADAVESWSAQCGWDNRSDP